jgi:hypothetical protein
MGDRASVGVKNFGETVYLYTHWGGTELAEVVKGALDRGRARWDDGAYLGRIVFEDMIDGQDDRGGTTGFGIMASPTGEEDPLIVLDCAKKTVTVSGRGECEDVPFGDYVADGVRTRRAQERDAGEARGAWRTQSV